MYYDELTTTIIARDRRRQIEADLQRDRILKAFLSGRSSDSIVKTVTHAVSQQWRRWFHAQAASRA
jgi:hypothetical protein